MTMSEAQSLNAFIRGGESFTEGQKLGPLSGLRVSVKDNIALDGAPVTGATPAFADLQLPENAAIGRLRDAGVVFVGKTNLHELAFGITGTNSHTGPALNPFDRSRLAGGSSSGAAISVAVGAADVAIATDTGGSCRVPAAHCGVVGFRPTTGRYPLQGYIEISPSRDTLGVLARTVEDVAKVDGVIMDDGQQLPEFSLQDIRIGAVAPECFGVGGDPKVIEAYNATLEKLKDQGVNIVEVDLKEAVAIDETCGFAIAVFETAQCLGALAENALGLSFDEFASRIKSDDVRGLIASQGGSEAIPQAVYDQAIEQLPQLRAAFADVFAKNSVDALMYPTSLFLPPSVDVGETIHVAGMEIPTFPAYSATTRPDSMSGQPSITLPYGMVEGLPVGLQLVGPSGADLPLLAMAALIEKNLPAPQRST